MDASMQLPSRWPVGVKLQPSESFGSWFARLAWAHGLSPSELYRVALPGGRIAGADLDRHACDDLIANLTIHTGVPRNDLEKATWRSWRGAVFGRDDGGGNLAWLPPGGRIYSNHSFGQQVCPSCLAADKEPYFRAEWRLGFVAACPHHHRLLVDRCPGCSSSIGAQAAPNNASLAKCGYCGFDLRNIAPIKVDEHDLAPQRRLLRITRGDWQHMGEAGPVHPVLFFRIFALLYRLVASGRHALPLRRHLMGPGSDIRAEAIPRLQEIERYPPRTRLILVGLAWQLAQDWPHRFAEACSAAGFHRWMMFKQPADVPFIYAAAVMQYLNGSTHHVQPDEIRVAAGKLEAEGEQPTYKALRGVLGVKFHAARHLAAPAKPHKPYGTHRYWKLDGVSPSTRAAVKAAAHHAGENVGAWVDQALREALAKTKKADG